MKVAIVGSRDYPHEDEIWTYISSRLSKGDIVVTGGARGVDTFAEDAAKSMNYETEIYLADWDKYGKSAGLTRNSLMIDAADRIVAFWDGKSKGTLDTIQKALVAKKNLEVYFP